VRYVSIHVNEYEMTLHCNISRPSCASCLFGTARKIKMDIVAIVMLGSVALWLFQQLDSSTL
jgi:hypothetical protein